MSDTKKIAIVGAAIGRLSTRLFYADVVNTEVVDEVPYVPHYKDKLYRSKPRYLKRTKLNRRNKP